VVAVTLGWPGWLRVLAPRR